MELTENFNFPLFAAKGKRKQKTSVCSLRTENGKWKFVFFSRQTMNSNQHLLLQQMCPSMIICV